MQHEDRLKTMKTEWSFYLSISRKQPENKKASLSHMSYAVNR